MTKDYVNRDVASISRDSQQTSTQLFKTLSDPKGLTPPTTSKEIGPDVQRSMRCSRAE